MLLICDLSIDFSDLLSDLSICVISFSRTIIVASDNPIEAEMLGERLAFFSRGRLIGVGSPEFYLKQCGFSSYALLH